MYKRFMYYGIVINMLMQMSCTLPSLQKEKLWQSTDNSLTWKNEKLKMKVTFPNESWKIHTKPTKKVQWEYFEDENTVLHAEVPELGVFLRINTRPNVSEDVDFKEIYTLWERTQKDVIDKFGQNNVLDYIPELTESENNKTGTITIIHKEMLNGVFFNFCDFYVLKKDKEKVIIFKFICREVLFKLKKQHFLDIANTYEFYNPEKLSPQN